MITGVCLLILTGVCWVGIGVVVNQAARRQWNLNVIQFGASVIVAAAALSASVVHPPLRGNPAAAIVLSGSVLVAGGFNYLMLNLMKRAMANGNSGAVWGIVQSALLLPFLMGMLFFRVEPTVFRLTGMGLILSGIFLFSRAEPVGREPSSSRWLGLALGAFAASGLAQCFANLPSYRQDVSMSSEFRAFLVQSGTIGAFAFFPGIKRGILRVSGVWKAILLLSTVQILSLFFFFYRGLNLVAEHHCGAIGYPVAQGSSIAGFLLYRRLILKEPPSRFSLPALLAVCAGIAVIVL